MENKAIARLLSETADLMEIAGEDPFRIRSYRNGASAVENHPERIADIAKDSNRSVTEIAGIGKGLAAVLGEILERGSFERRDQLLEKYPPTALEFLKIQGLGPKSIALIWEHYRISTIDDLERLCLEQKLRVLPRMGAKLEEKVLRSIAHYRKSAGRFLLSFADDLAGQLVEYLAAGEGVVRVTPAGSLRRGKETVGDLDLLVTGPGAAGALDRFVTYPDVTEVLGKGPNKASAKVGDQGIQVDVRALPEDSFGAALQYFTGSKEHNVALRTRAVKQGLKLSEYGLFRGGGRPENRVRQRGGDLRGARDGLDSSGAARELGRDRIGRRRPSPAPGGTRRHPRRPAHAHARKRRPGLARRNGRSRESPGLRIHRHHRPLQGAGHGERAG